MKVKQDFLRVQTSPFNAETGERMEPEEKPTQRVIIAQETAVNQHGQALGNFNVAITADSSAGEIANKVRNMCFGCKHFNTHQWRKLQLKWEAGTMEERQLLNNMRAGLLDTSNASINDMHTDQGGEMDIEAALGQMGVCESLTEIERDPIIVHPLGFCPPGLETLYKAKDTEEEKRGSAAFDSIMRQAQGQS